MSTGERPPSGASVGPTTASVSVIRLGHVLLLTVPPEAEDGTIEEIQNGVLAAMEQHETTGLVLDLGAVEIVDSFFARAIDETAQMVALMGGRTVIAGLRPAVAISAVQLGITLSSAMTALDVDRALALLGHGEWAEARR